MANACKSAIKAAAHPGFEIAAGGDAYPILPPRGANHASYIEAQNMTREWADKAIDLRQAGDTDQARHAKRQAEVWLDKMLGIETEIFADTRLSKVVEGLANNAGHKDRTPTTTCSRIHGRSVLSEQRSMVTNNVILRAWQR